MVKEPERWMPLARLLLGIGAAAALASAGGRPIDEALWVGFGVAVVFIATAACIIGGMLALRRPTRILGSRSPDG